MLDSLNIFLEVEEQVGHSNKEKRIMYLSINSEIENLKLYDIPSYLGMENASVRVTHNQDDESYVSSAYANCWEAGETKVSEFAIFSLMEAIENNSSMKKTLERGLISNPDHTLITEKETKEQLAIKELSKIIDDSKLDEICEKIRSFSSPVQIYDLIKEFEIIPKTSTATR